MNIHQVSPAILVVALWFVPSQSLAQHRRPIEASDRVFVELERLQAFGMLDTIPVGHRAGLERVIREALAGEIDSWPKTGAPASVSEIERLVEPPTLEFGLEFSYVWADVRPRAVPGNGLGGIDAKTVRLAEERGGRVLDDGSNWVVEPGFRWRSGEWSGALSGRVRWLSRQGSQPTEGRIQEVLAEGPFGPLYLTVGRAPIVWGVSPFGGQMHSGHARALDQVTIASDGTFRFPWIFGFLGPSRPTLSVARLERARDIPHSILVAYKVSAKPSRSVEIGLGILNHSWGEGAPSASLGRHLIDYLIIPEKLAHDLEAGISNNLLGFEVRWRLPGTRGTHLYGAITIDDVGLDGRLLKQDGAYLGGLTIPRLWEDGSVGLRLEYRRTGIRFYQHGQFTSGLTFDGVIVGDPLGPDGRGLYLVWDAQPNDRDRITFQLLREERSRDHYLAGRNPRGDLSLTRTDDLPEERRIQADVSWEREWLGGFLGGATTLVRAGYERVSNFNFEAEAPDSGAILEFRVTVGTEKDRPSS